MIHRNEVKLKERLLPFLTKERGYGIQGTLHCGEVTRKYMGELMEIKVILVTFVYADSFWCGLSISRDKSCSSHPSIGEVGYLYHFHKDIFMPCF